VITRTPLWPKHVYTFRPTVPNPTSLAARLPAYTHTMTRFNFGSRAECRGVIAEDFPLQTTRSVAAAIAPTCARGGRQRKGVLVWLRPPLRCADRVRRSRGRGDQLDLEHRSGWPQTCPHARDFPARPASAAAGGLVITAAKSYSWNGASSTRPLRQHARPPSIAQMRQTRKACCERVPPLPPRTELFTGWAARTLPGHHRN